MCEFDSHTTDSLNTIPVCFTRVSLGVLCVRGLRWEPSASRLCSVVYYVLWNLQMFIFIEFFAHRLPSQPQLPTINIFEGNKHSIGISVPNGSKCSPAGKPKLLDPRQIFSISRKHPKNKASRTQK